MPFLVRAGLVSDPPLADARANLEAATPLIQERINTLSDAVDLLAFLFIADAKLTIAPTTRVWLRSPVRRWPLPPLRWQLSRRSRPPRSKPPCAPPWWKGSA